MRTLALTSVALLLMVPWGTARAATVLFDLQGTGGVGMLNTNEPGSPAGGTGGEVGAGISYDTTTKVLSINVAWGSANGFTNMTGVVNGQHIHGPTASANGAGFTQTAGVLFSLTTTTNTATGGSISNNITLTAAQETDLLAGKYYINVHTPTNSGGEARGFLVQAVPEPSRMAFALLGLSLVALRRKR